MKTAFLSSTARDLAEYRDAAYKAIEGLDDWHCVRMEDFGARDWTFYDFSLVKVAECDLFVGIVGHLYGSCPKGSEQSYTEREYEAAVAAGIPRLVFIAPEDFPLPANLREPEEKWRRHRALRERVSQARICDTFTSPEDLARRVVQAIRNWEQEQAAIQQHPLTARSYDVFISYSHRDSEWVRNWLLPRLEGAGLRVCIDFRDFEIGVPSLVNMEQAAMEQSRKTLLVLSPHWVKSEWTNFEALLVQTDDPIGLRRRILPLMLERCEPPRRIAMLTYADFTSPERWESQLQRIIASFGERVGQPPDMSPERLERELKRILDSFGIRVGQHLGMAQTISVDTDEEQQHLRELVTIKRRRLRVLEIQEAKLSIYVPPHVMMEIEDLRREIAALKAQLRDTAEWSVQMERARAKPARKLQ